MPAAQANGIAAGLRLLYPRHSHSHTGRAMLHLIWTILIGFVAGLIAKAVTPGAGPSGFILTSVLGIAGSLAATYLGQALGWYPPGHVAGFIASIIGAIVLLLGYHLVTRNSGK